MNIYGYAQNKDDLLSLRDVTIKATPEEIRKVAEFLLHCASMMERNTAWEHEHFNDYIKTSDFSSDIVVFAS